MQDNSRLVTFVYQKKKRIPMECQVREYIFKDCPIRQVLSNICAKWPLLVIYVMRGEENMRFSAIRKRIPDISQKMLTSTLRSLEADGFVTRRVFAEVPPRVEYSLTERAHTFIPLMENLIDWASRNMAGIVHDREKFDA